MGQKLRVVAMSILIQVAEWVVGVNKMDPALPVIVVKLISI
jgi:hypothetical protein